MVTICEICNKEFASRQSLWNHKTRKHVNTDNHNDNHDNHCDNHNDNPNDYRVHSKNKKYYCTKCNKIFNNYQNRWRHEKNCDDIKTIHKKDEIIETLQQKIIRMEEQYVEEIKKQSELINQLMAIMNKNCKIHPRVSKKPSLNPLGSGKTLQKINKQLGNNNVINEYNGPIQNNLIISMGKEKLCETFSKKEKINVLNRKFNSLPYLIEYAHFNDKYPQFIRLVSILLKQNSNPSLSTDSY